MARENLLGNLGTDGTLHRFIMSLLCLGPSERREMVSGGNRFSLGKGGKWCKERVKKLNLDPLSTV
jgi:hypothetical protein